MAVSYFYQFQNEKPMLISPEVLFEHYVKGSTNITRMGATPARLEISLGNEGHKHLVIEQGTGVTTVTLRHILPRMR